MTDKRIRNEKDFCNKKIIENTRASTGRFYSIAKNSALHYQERVLFECRRKDVLEYGCGTGSLAFMLVAHGANVIGIDISEEAIRKASEAATAKGLSSRVSFLVMNAEELQFSAKHFDVICGTSILHHLDLRSALTEISRVLKEDGRAFFIEPLGHNPLINLYRKVTPGLRSEDEHPLVSRDLAMMKEYFGKVDITFFHLATLIAIPLRNTAVFDPALRLLEAADRMLFKMPFFSRQAWQCLIELSQPVAKSLAG